MQKLSVWIKNNKALSIALIFIALLITPYIKTLAPLGTERNIYKAGGIYPGEMEVTSFDSQAGMAPRIGGFTPTPNITDRKVITNSNLSIVVQNVKKTLDKISIYAKEVGGYMVNSSVHTPEGLSNGNITIRIPTEKLDEAVSYLRDVAVKVVSENTSGTDITDEYTDLEEQLATLLTAKVKFETILNSATDIEDIMNVTERILQIQARIDNVKGRVEYLDKASDTTLITVYLSTDEFELPYTPDSPWRPGVVFKLAVRSIVGLMQTLGSGIIYLIVYLPLVIILVLIWKRFSNKNSK